MYITVKKLIEDLNLEPIVLNEKSNLNQITYPGVSRPGLELAGYMDYYNPKKILMFGNREVSFFNKCDEETQVEVLNNMLMGKITPPAIIFSCAVKIPEIFVEYCKKSDIALLRGDLRTQALTSKVFSYLKDMLLERIKVHGVLLDIFGMGTLIVGKSGVGKSEIALELIKRGHQLIADDSVEIYQKEVGILIGEAPDTLKKYLEVRGIGIIDVINLYGASSYRENKKIRLVVELKKWDEHEIYDRLGLDSDYQKFFDTEVHKITVPVSPGRNMATILEAAAMNEKLKYLGYNSARDFTDNIMKYIKQKENENND